MSNWSDAAIPAAAWLLPVGTPGGINSGLDGVPAGSGIVRLGDEIIRLDAATYRLWRGAAAAPPIGELISWGNTQGIDDATGRLRELKTAGLLIGDGPDVHRRVGRLALRLIGECMGNGLEAGPTFLLLGRNNARLVVDAYLFEVLLRSDGVSPVSVLCDAVDASRHLPRSRPSVEALADGLPTLVRNEVVLLEAAIR
jgi:hypothetical protein